MKTLKDLDPVEFQILRRTQSVRQIAIAYSTTANAIYHWCTKYNVFVSRITDWEIQEGLQQQSVKELAAEYNVTVGTIYNRAAALGIDIKAVQHNRIITAMQHAGTIKQNAYEAGLTPNVIYNFRYRYSHSNKNNIKTDK